MPKSYKHCSGGEGVRRGKAAASGGMQSKASTMAIEVARVAWEMQTNAKVVRFNSGDTE